MPIDPVESVTASAFKLCDIAQPDGLTWDEVDNCEEFFCDLLPFYQCPKLEDFQDFDGDGNGILTWEEFEEHFHALQADLHMEAI